MDINNDDKLAPSPRRRRSSRASRNSREAAHRQALSGDRRSLRRRSQKVTPEMAAQIKTLVDHFGMLQHDVAARFGINQGRVSEIMTGGAFPDVPPAPIDKVG
jgi:hypothetical protein